MSARRRPPGTGRQGPRPRGGLSYTRRDARHAPLPLPRAHHLDRLGLRPTNAQKGMCRETLVASWQGERAGRGAVQAGDRARVSGRSCRRRAATWLRRQLPRLAVLDVCPVVIAAGRLSVTPGLATSRTRGAHRAHALRRLALLPLLCLLHSCRRRPHPARLDHQIGACIRRRSAVNHAGPPNAARCEFA